MLDFPRRWSHGRVLAHLGVFIGAGKCPAISDPAAKFRFNGRAPHSTRGFSRFHHNCESENYQMHLIIPGFQGHGTCVRALQQIDGCSTCSFSHVITQIRS